MQSTLSQDTTLDHSMQSQIMSMLNSFLEENNDDHISLDNNSMLHFDRNKTTKALSQKQESSNELYMNLLHAHHNQHNDIAQQKHGKKYEEKMVIELEKMLLKANAINVQLFHYFEGNFVHLLKKQQASRLCQYYLPNTSLDVLYLLYKDIKPFLHELLFDSYANYFCMKLFMHLPPLLRNDYLFTIQTYIPSLAMNKISTSSIQSIIANLCTDQEQGIVVNSVLQDLYTICLDVYGTHLIEKMLSCFEYKNIKVISSFILENFVFFAENPNSLCLIKTILVSEYKKDNFAYMKHIIHSNAIMLAQNQFASYIFPICFDKWEKCEYEEIISAFEGKGVYLSLQKYSANVIEKFIKKSEAFLIQFINEIACDANDCISLFMNNSFAIFVMQTAIAKSVSCQQMHFAINILMKIIRNIDTVHNQKLTRKWNNIINKYSYLLFNNNNLQYDTYSMVTQSSF